MEVTGGPTLVVATIVAVRGGGVLAAGSGQAASTDGGAVRAYESPTEAVTVALAALAGGAAVGMAVGEVDRGPGAGATPWDGPAVPVARALAERAAAAGCCLLATATVAALATVPGLRSRSAGTVETPTGTADVVELRPPAPADPVVLRVPLPPALAIGEPFRFVPREQLWHPLREAWDAVVAGGRQVILAGGEAGTGKTRLVTEFARYVHDQGGGVALFGSCADQLSVPYQPFSEALDHLVASLDAVALATVARGVGPDLTRLAPRLVAALGPPGAGGDTEGERYRLYSATADLLANVARRRPVLLVLDDLHWASRPTVDLLDHLTRTPAVAHLLVVATYRATPGEVGGALKAALPGLRRLPGVTRLRVTGFDRDEVRRFVEGAGGRTEGAVPRALVDGLAEQTDGNAFLLGELWRHLVEAGQVRCSGGVWRTSGPLEEVVSPEGVREVVEARLARLPEPTRQMLGVAAVIGTAFGDRVLAAATGHDGRAVVSALEPAVRAGLVDEAGVGAYRFTHVILRRAVYDNLPLSHRRAHHLDVARALEHVLGDRAVAEVAHHTVAAVPLADPADAVAVARRAAAAAAGAVAHADAARHLEAVLPLAPPDEERGALLLQLADAHMRSGDVATAQLHCLEARALARTLALPRLLVAAALAYDDANWRAALHGDVAAQLLQEALPHAGDEVTEVRLRAALGRALAFAGRGDDAHVLGERALADARRLGDQTAQVTAFTAVLSASWDPSRLDRQLARAREFTELAHAIGDAESEVWALAKVLYGSISTGDLDGARAAGARHGAITRRLGQPLFTVLDHQAAALLATGEGRFADAEALATRSDDLARHLSGNDASGGYGVQLFSIRREQGRLAEALPVVEAVARLGREGAAWRPALAVLSAELGLVDEAAAEVRHLVAEGLRAVPRDSLWWGSLAYLADACVATGDAASGAVVYDELAAYRGRVVQVGTFLAAYGAADRYLGALAALLGRPDAARAHLDAALRIDEAAGMPAWVARTRLVSGQVLAGWGGAADQRAANAHLRAALRTARSLGMEAVAASAAAALDALAQRRTGEPTGAAGIDGLSEREVDVLRLIAEGLTNRDIGRRLHISQHTAANHVRSILQKTACANRTEAAAWASRRGLASG